MLGSLCVQDAQQELARARSAAALATECSDAQDHHAMVVAMGVALMHFEALDSILTHTDTQPPVEWRNGE